MLILFVLLSVKSLSESIENVYFPDDLKLTNITPVYKKNSRNKANCRSVSILPGLSKILKSVFMTKLAKM